MTSVLQACPCVDIGVSMAGAFAFGMFFMLLICAATRLWRRDLRADDDLVLPPAAALHFHTNNDQRSA